MTVKSGFMLSFLLVLTGLFIASADISAAHAEEQLQITDLVVGTGDEAVRHSIVTIHYTGWLMDGTMFETSLEKGMPIVFPLGVGRVIPGWDMGVMGMKVGGKRELIIPAVLAYGSSKDKKGIPPDSDLRFEVEMIDINLPDYNNITIDQLKEMLDDNIKIIDLRRQDEWDDTGVVEGSIKLTAFDANGAFIQSFPQEFQNLVAKDEPVVLICRSGNRSSRIANAFSGQAGYTNIYNVAGGIKAWIKAGNPVVK